MEMLKYTLSGILFGIFALLNPASAQEESRKGEKKVEVNIEILDEGGGEVIYLNGEEVTEEELESKLVELELDGLDEKLEWIGEEGSSYEVVKEFEWTGDMDELAWTEILQEFRLMAFPDGNEEIEIEVTEILDSELSKIIKQTEEGMEINVDGEAIFIPKGAEDGEGKVFTKVIVMQKVMLEDLAEEDVSMLKKNGLMSPEEELKSDWDISLYPNPNQGKFTIDLGEEPTENTQLELFSVDGAKVFSHLIPKSDGNTSDVIDVPELEGGSYILQITQGERVEYRKMIIQ